MQRTAWHRILSTASDKIKLDCRFKDVIFSVDVNECLGNPCDKNATCGNTAGSFTCTCNIGYTGNGTHCRGKIFMVHLTVRLTIVAL